MTDDTFGSREEMIDRYKEVKRELAAIKRHAEAMATTLDDWSRIDECPCVALDAYRAAYPKEPT